MIELIIALLQLKGIGRRTIYKKLHINENDSCDIDTIRSILSGAGINKKDEEIDLAIEKAEKKIKGFIVSLCAAGSTLTGCSFLAQSTEVKETTAATEGKTAETETARTFADNSGAKAFEEDAIYDNFPLLIILL